MALWYNIVLIVKTPHLFSALVATLLLVLVALGGNVSAQSLEEQYVHGLAPWMFEQKNQGSALQRAAFETTDLLPVYGSSELNYDDPYNPQRFFWNYPSGFAVFPVGTADTEPLIMIQKFAALGPVLRGKKVVISLSPSFYYEGKYHSETYDGNFSPLHANALAFSTDLSLAEKQAVATRMLDYPESLQKDPFLRFALERLVDNSILSQAVYALMLPLGQFHVWVLNLQDHWEMANFIYKNETGIAKEIEHAPRFINWRKVLTRADAEYRPHTTNNQFGMDNDQYNYYRNDIIKGKNSTTDARFLALVANSKGWTDLDLLLHGLQDLGAQPLLILIPMNGSWFDWQGISYSARTVLYDKFRAMAKAHNTPAIILDDHDQDKYFLIDPGAHLSSRGWVFYDQVLDQFYHNTLPADGKNPTIATPTP